jgi:tRNA modification GTPase
VRSRFDSIYETSSIGGGAIVWRVVNKIDIAMPTQIAAVGGKKNVHFVSSATGEGIDSLIGAIARFCEQFFSPEPALVTRERQRGYLNETVARLRSAEEAEEREEIVAEHLRLAARSLGKLLGRVDVEDVLDVIFRDFCIGK